ncbi:MAG: hemolysin family protein [Bacteroidota bacterium]
MSDWTIILLSLLFSAFASGSEIAFLSSNKLRIELERSQGNFAARLIWNFVKSPSHFIATMLLANNVALVIYGIVMTEELMTPDVLKGYLPRQLHAPGTVLVIQTFLSTMVILVSAEFIPKVVFRLNPNGILNLLAVPIRLVYLLLYPIVWLVISLSKLIMRGLFNVELTEERPVFGRVDLDLYVRELTARNSQVEEIETEMRIFQNALDFKDVKVRECMVPRNEIVAIEVTEPVQELMKLFIETKLSKILVYRDSIDNLIGFVHSSEMFKRPATIGEVMLPVQIVPEAMSANDLMKQFTNQHRSVAVVVDEFGGTSGMATLEDVMEEIFGDIQDEHDLPEETERRISEHEFLFSARLEIDYLNKKYELGLPEHDAYETLGGFILHFHENLPAQGEEIVIPPYYITAIKVTGSRIDQVRIRIETEN